MFVQSLLRNYERLMETAKTREASSMPRPSPGAAAAGAAAAAAAASEGEAAARAAADLEDQERQALLESQRKQAC